MEKFNYRRYVKSHEYRARARILRVARDLFLEARADQYKPFRALMWEAFEALCSVLEVTPNEIAEQFLKEEGHDGRDRNVG